MNLSFYILAINSNFLPFKENEIPRFTYERQNTGIIPDDKRKIWKEIQFCFT